MAKIFENSQLVFKLDQDDPECNYVNRMMEMSPDFLRNLNKNGTSYDTLHGVVPTYKLPIGYSYGNIDMPPIYKSISEKMNNKSDINLNKQDSAITNSVIRNGYDNAKNIVDEKIIATVKGDLTLSDDDDLDHNVKAANSSKIDNITDNFRLLFDTLEACSKKMPMLSSLNIFQKHYKPNHPDSVHDFTDHKKDVQNTDVISDTGDVTKQCAEDLQKFISLLSESTYKSNLSSSFQTIYNIVNTNGKRKHVPEKIVEKSVTPPKVPRQSPVPIPKKSDTPETSYQFYSKDNSIQLHFNAIPKLSKEICEKLLNSSRNLPKEVTMPVSEIKQKLVTQDSLPFTKLDSLPKKENKVFQDISTVPVNKPLTNNISSDNNLNPARKPEAAAKQYFANHSNYSHTNNTKVAIVAGKINEAQSNIQHKNNPNKSSHQLIGKVSSVNPVVQGLLAMRQMRTTFKNDFIQRMRNLDNDKWLKDVQSLEEKAMKFKGQLDYAPHIMVYIRKNLFYNYSLEVKSDYGMSHKVYLKNAAMIKNNCSIITHIYNEHEKQIKDQSSSRLWNIKLVKHFTVILCHRLSAILQYRAFRNVAEDCKKLYETLVRAGVIERTMDTNGANVLGAMPGQMTSSSTYTHTHSNSPLSNLSSYSHTSSPGGPCTAAPGSLPIVPANAGTNLSGALKADLQRYIDQINIINSSYNDWMIAEKHHAGYCSRSGRHEESWRDFEWKIVEKTGGVLISGIDESVPFVIKFLEGYINYMDEFMKRNL